MQKTKCSGLLAAAALLATVPAQAHHSFAAEFDGSRSIRLAGTITRIEWTNPHSYFFIDVKDDKGNVVFTEEKLAGEITLQTVLEDRSKASYDGPTES